MFRRMKAVTAAAAVAGIVALAGASNASAFNVGTLSTPIGSGSMPIAANAGSSRLVVNNAIALNCTDTRATGNIATGVYPNTFPQTVGTIQPIFSNVGGADCVGPSNFLFGVSCTNTANLQVTGLPAGGPPAVTPGRITNISCVVTFTALGCSATVTGTVQGNYRNPTAAAPGVLTVNTAGQSLNVVSGCPAAVLPSGTAQYGAPGAGSLGLANLPYTLTGASSGHPFIS